MYHIGCDVSATFSVFYVRETGQHLKVSHRDFSALSKLPTPGKVALEQTGRYSLALINELKARGFEVFLVEGKHVHAMRKMAGTSAKDDLSDARLLADYLLISEMYGSPDGLLRFTTYEPSFYAYNLRQLVFHYERLNKEVTRYNNRLKQTIIVVAPHLYKNKGKYTSRQLQKLLETLSSPTPFSGYIAEARFYISFLLALYQELEKVKKEMINFASMHPDYQLLMTVPGMGPITASYLIASYRDISLFPTKNHFVKYMGFAKMTLQSGTSVKKRRRVNSNPMIRKILWMFFISQKNMEPWKSLAEHYSRLSGGKTRKTFEKFGAKFLRVLFGMLKGRAPFDPERLKPKKVDAPPSAHKMMERSPGVYSGGSQKSLKNAEKIPAKALKISHKLSKTSTGRVLGPQANNPSKSSQNSPKRSKISIHAKGKTAEGPCRCHNPGTPRGLSPPP